MFKVRQVRSRWWWISFLLSWSILPAQLTITVTSVPASTPANADIFIAGNFNSWNPGDPTYKLTPIENGMYTITFSPSPGTLQFKFTRGSWATVEGTASGTYIPNRSYSYSGNPSTLDVSIAGWEDIGKHTAASNVQILDENYFMPQLNRHRRIWLYLPPDYNTTSKHYPVIYMQDGQNLFDTYYSFAGEWKIDESLNDLFAQGDYGAIVVGIDNGGTERINEYSPWVNPGYGGGQGEAYVSFIVHTLKPHIDSTFRTLPTGEYTAIAGSSMGGLISMYAAATYPEVFGKAGIFSPAFWFSDSLFLHVMHQKFPEDIRTYFVAGENESADMVPYMQAMDELLLEKGIDSSNLKLVAEADGAHAEWFWAREFPDAYEWLFDNLILVDHVPSRIKCTVYPNPVDEYIYVSPEIQGLQYSIYSMFGEPLLADVVNLRKINVTPLKSGLYILELSDPWGHLLYCNRFFKS